MVLAAIRKTLTQHSCQLTVPLIDTTSPTKGFTATYLLLFSSEYLLHCLLCVPTALVCESELSIKQIKHLDRFDTLHAMSSGSSGQLTSCQGASKDYFWSSNLNWVEVFAAWHHWAGPGAGWWCRQSGYLFYWWSLVIYSSISHN